MKGRVDHRGDMERYRLPNPTYVAWPLGAALLTQAGTVVETIASSADWWVPAIKGFGLLIVGVGIGALIHDFRNRNSWLWANVAHFRRSFVVESAWLAHEVTSNVEWLQFRVRVRFIRAANVRTAIMVRSAINLTHARDSFILEKDAGSIRVLKDETRTFLLASLPIKNHNAGQALPYQSWGGRLRLSGDASDQHSLSNGTENVVEVSATTWRGTHMERVALALPYPDSHTFGRFIFYGDNEFVSVAGD